MQQFIFTIEYVKLNLPFRQFLTLITMEEIIYRNYFTHSFIIEGFCIFKCFLQFLTVGALCLLPQYSPLFRYSFTIFCRMIDAFLSSVNQLSYLLQQSIAINRLQIHLINCVIHILEATYFVYYCKFQLCLTLI